MALDRMIEALKRTFDDGEVESPLQFRYVAQLRLVLSTIGAWPHAQFGRARLGAALSRYSLLLSALAATLILLAITYIWHYRDTMSFSHWGHIMLLLGLESMLLQRLLMSRTKKYREVLKDYLLEFHLFHFKSQSPYSAKIHEKIHMISGALTMYAICQMLGGVVLFTFTPLYNNYHRGMLGAQRPANLTFEHAAYYYCGTDVFYTSLRGYWFLFAFNVLAACHTTVGIITFDLLLCLIVFQIWGHLTILKHKLLNMPLPASEFAGIYSAEENIFIRRLLKEIILYHNFIIKFVDRCSEAFSEHLFVFYLIMQVITCVLLVEVSSFTAEALAKYGPLTIDMHCQLILVSILFEMINTKSEQLIDAVYATPWESMDVRNRRTLLFLLQRVQRPVSLKAAKVVPVGVTTMSAVLKTTFSYYMMLHAMAEDR